MKKLVMTGIALAGLGLGWLHAQTPTAAQAQSQTPTVTPVDAPPRPTGILVMDPAMNELIDSSAKIEPVIQDFFYFTEGIVWVPEGKSGGHWLFAEMAANKVLKLTTDGKLSLFLDDCGYQGWDSWRHGFTQTNGKAPNDPDFKRFNLPGCNGIARDNQGRLVLATWGGRSIDRLEKNGKRVQLTGSVDGKRFNSTNDLVVKKNGAIYFTDGPGCGGLRLQCNDPEKGIDYNGVFMWKNGKTTALARVENANGLALSPDEQYLYTNGSRLVRKFKVLPDDTLDVASMQVIMDKVKDPLPGITDGMKVDSQGNIWESCCGGIVVLSPEGKQLGMVYTPESVANLNWGDPDLKTLYIVARTSIYKIRTKVAGIPGR